MQDTGRFEYNDFAGKRILIIGCVQGLGRSIAQGCSAAGAELFLIDVNPEVEKVAIEIQKAGGNAKFHIADICNSNALMDLFKELAENHGFSGMIYTPRGREPKKFMEFKPENWDADLNIALKGAFFCAQAAIPHLAKKQNEDAFIIYISSTLSQMIGTESVGYHTAKGGLDNLTRYLAVKLGPMGIRVNAVQLGWFIKDMHMEHFYAEENNKIRQIACGSNPLNRVGTSEDLVNAILFLGSHRARFITGQILCIDGGLTIQDQAYIYQKLKGIIE